MTSTSTIRGLLAALLILASPFAYAEVVSVHVLSNSENRAYQQILGGFTQSIQEIGIAAEILVLYNPPEQDAAEANLAFALDDSTVKHATILYSDKPVVLTMLIHPELLPNKTSIAGVLLEFSTKTELTWIKKAFPKHSDLGVLCSPDTHTAKVETAKKIARSMGVRLHAIPVSHLNDLPDALNVLGKKSTIMWGMADAKLLNAKTARLILSFTLKNHIPFIDPSEAWVKAGATFALVRSYEDIGKQCASLTKQLLEKPSNNGVAFQHPRKLNYTINAKQAKYLKIKFPKEIIDHAMVVNP